MSSSKNKSENSSTLFLKASWKIVFVVSLVFLTCVIMGSAHKAMATSNDTGIIIPLYSYPGPTWEKIMQEKKTHQSVPMVVIINPDNGPGIKNSDYISGIKNLQSSGIVVLGYVYTGSTDMDTVTSQIDNYKNWYNVNGIFFDQMYNEKGYEAYYRHLSSYAKHLGLNMTVGNPGVDTIPSYIGTVDNIVIHDNPGLPPITALDGWHTNYTKSNFSTISYKVDNINETFLADATRYVKFLYTTDSVDENPFDSLPSYLDSLLGNLTRYQNSDTVTITVNAKSIQGKPIDGLWAIAKSSNDSRSGFTPFSFLVASKNPQIITISDFKNYTFDHWDNNSTNKNRTVLPIQNMTLAAYFRTNNQIVSDIKDAPSDIFSNIQNQDNEKPLIEEDGAPLSVNIYYMTGDRAGHYSTSLKIYQDFNKKPFKEIESISDNPYTITSLPLYHNYKIEVYVNGIFAAVNYVYLTGSQQSLDFKIPLPGGMRITAVYNDNFTPIDGATITILSNNNKTLVTGVTDENGHMLRQWIEPTIISSNYYMASIKVGQLSYNYFPIHLQPGYAQEIKISTPWPPIINSLITVKVYDEQPKPTSESNSSFIVSLYDENQNKIMTSGVTNRGEAYFYNLKVGDYTLIVINQNNGTELAQQNVTLDGNKLNFTMKL